MTVAELRAELADMPDDAEVRLDLRSVRRTAPVLHVLLSNEPLLSGVDAECVVIRADD